MKCQYDGCQEGNFCLGYYEETDEYEWSACPCCGGWDWQDCQTCNANAKDLQMTENQETDNGKASCERV